MVLLTLAEDNHLEEGPSSACVDVAVAQGQVLDRLVDREAVGQLDHSLAAEVIVVQLQNLQRRACLRMNELADELAPEGRDLVVKQIELENCLDLLQALTHCPHALVLAEGLPQAHGLRMWVAKAIISTFTYLTCLSESVIARTPCQPSSSQKWNYAVITVNPTLSMGSPSSWYVSYFSLMILLTSQPSSAHFLR